MIQIERKLRNIVKEVDLKLFLAKYNYENVDILRSSISYR